MTVLPLPKDMDERLSALANKAHLSTREYALQLLARSLEDEEDAAIALPRLERIDEGIDTPVPLEDVVKKYRDKNGSANLEF